MAARWIRHLPVVADDEVLGVVSMRDITGIFAALAPGRVAVEHEFDQLVRNAAWPASSTATSTNAARTRTFTPEN